MTSLFEQNEGTYQPGFCRFFYEMKCKVVCHDRPLGKGTDGCPTNLPPYKHNSVVLIQFL